MATNCGCGNLGKAVYYVNVIYKRNDNGETEYTDAYVCGDHLTPESETRTSYKAGGYEVLEYEVTELVNRKGRAVVSDGATEFVLRGWKSGVATEPIRITSGHLRHCNAEQRARTKQGWLCASYPKGAPPAGLRMQVAETMRDMG
jgi:hypothetical protein